MQTFFFSLKQMIDIISTVNEKKLKKMANFTVGMDVTHSSRNFE
jgi:hypothetical protein